MRANKSKLCIFLLFTPGLLSPACAGSPRSKHKHEKGFPNPTVHNPLKQRAINVDVSKQRLLAVKNSEDLILSPRGEMNEPNTSGESSDDNEISFRVEESLSYRQIITPGRRISGSLSIGFTNRGRLVRGARLPIRGKNHEIMPFARKRHTNYGTIELVRLLIRAAAATAEKHRGSIMGVGNISERTGGRLRWSRSHRSGRDADIAFFVKLQGKPARSPGFVRFADETLLSHTGKYSFDVERNWILVEYLLTQEEAPVQWIFVANHIKTALLKHAEQNDADPGLLRKAENILWQPTRGSPHNDHFHVRIYCSRDDLLEGCRNVRPFWDGIQPYDNYLEARILRLVSGMNDPNPEIREAAVNFLTRIDGIRAAPDIAHMGLWDPSPDVRSAVIDALVNWRSNHPVVLRSLVDLIVRNGTGFIIDDPSLDKSRILRTLAPTSHLDPKRHGLTYKPAEDNVRTPGQIRRAYVALEKISSRRMSPFIAEMLKSKRVIAPVSEFEHGLPEVTLAAWSARNLLDESLVESLIDVLEHRDPGARNAAALILRRITVHSFRYEWGQPMNRFTRMAAADRWRRWWKKNRSIPREKRLVRLLEIVRPALRKYDNLEHPMALRNIIAVTAYDNYLGYNAHRLLMDITKLRKPQYDWIPSRRSHFWLHWWTTNYPEAAARLNMNHPESLKRKKPAH